MNYTQEQILDCLRKVRYPDGNSDIVNLGMVENIKIEENTVNVSVLLPVFNSPFKKSIKRACEKSIKELVGENIDVQANISSKVTNGRADDDKKEVLPKVKNIIAVASGKGGVGKSTVSVNLAVALSMLGSKVGLIDADVYGPSIPKMFGAEEMRPGVVRVNNKDLVVPIEKHGVKMLSIGFFVKPEDALIWRGAMATNFLQQLINDSDWGELDYLIIDLPPGTGDIHLTMVQTVPVTGAVIVSTPQDVALADAIKGINMFKQQEINVPILGLIENMSWFTPDELPDKKYYIFGQDGCKKLAEEMNTNLLGQIPIKESIRQNGDFGTPSALEDTATGEAFRNLAENVAEKVEERNRTLKPTEKVKMNDEASCST